MNGSRKGLVEKIIYNNKLLMVFCILISVAIWSAVKINYSAETTRTISDVKITITSNSENAELIPFIDEKELYAEVVVGGKAYNINSYALSKDDIVVEATTTYVDSAGYKVLNLTAEASETGDLSDVEVISINPSTITVYYDRKATQTFNVEAKLTNEIDSLVDGEYSVGQPVPSLSTVDVTGPASILNKMTKVYFEASVLEEDLPLTEAKVIPADVTFELERQRDAEYLVCESINDESNPATVTIPVYVSKNVPTQVKFINQPSYFAENPPEVKIYPSEVKISYSPADSDKYEFITVGTIDFKELSDKVNTFEFEVEDALKNSANADTSFSKFKVTVDMSSMSQKTFDLTGSNIVLLNQTEGYSYSVDSLNSELDSVVIVGPESSLEKIKAEDIQVEINVSSLSVNARLRQSAEVTNISIVNSKINDCWIYGKYDVMVNITPVNK